VEKKSQKFCYNVLTNIIISVIINTSKDTNAALTATRAGGEKEMKKTEVAIEIKPLEIVKTNVRIVGDTPLIMHKWSEKAKKEMLDKQMKVTKTKGREAKNPVDDFIQSMYWMTDKPEESTMEAFDEAIARGAKFGFPVTSIKLAAIAAAYRAETIKNMASARGTFFIKGYGSDLLGQIDSEPPVMREDMVRVGMGTADLRYRGEFRNWSMNLEISYNKNGAYTLEQIVNMINMGGYMCGIGEWRPEKDGQFGMFHVE
jgi:hypothetical protein